MPLPVISFVRFCLKSIPHLPLLGKLVENMGAGAPSTEPGRIGLGPGSIGVFTNAHST